MNFKIGDKVKKIFGSMSPYIGIVTSIDNINNRCIYLSGIVLDTLTASKKINDEFSDDSKNFIIIKKIKVLPDYL